MPAGIVEDAGAVDDGQELLPAHEDLVRAQVAVRTAGDDLGHLLFLEAQLGQGPDDILADRGRRHAVEVVGDAAHRHRLAGGEGLPELVAAGLGPESGPFHELGRAFVRAEEEDDLLVAVIHDAGVGEHEVEEAVDVLLEGRLGPVLESPAQEDGPLGAAVGQVLVLPLLGQGQVVVFVEDEVGVRQIALEVGRPDDPDAAAGDVPEPDVEAPELAADDMEHAERLDGVIDRVEEIRPVHERDGDLLPDVEVRLEDDVHEEGGGLEDVPVGLGRDRLLDVLPQGGQAGLDVGVLDGRIELPVEEGEQLPDEARVGEEGLPAPGFGVGLPGQLDLEVAEDAQELGRALEGVGELQVFLVVAAEELVGEAPGGVGEHELLRRQGALPEERRQGALRDDVNEADVLDEVPELFAALDLVQVEGVDGPAVPEVLDVFPLGEQPVAIDDVRDVGEEPRAGVGPGHDRDAELLVPGDRGDVDERAFPALGPAKQALVPVDGLLGHGGEERLVPDLADVRLVRAGLFGRVLRLVDDVHPEVLEAPGLAQGPVGLEPVMGIFVLDPLFDLDAPAVVLLDEVQGVVLVLGLEVDADDLLLAERRQDLGRPEGLDMVGDGLQGGRPEVELAHPQAGGEGVQLPADRRLGVEAVRQHDLLDLPELDGVEERQFGDIANRLHGDTSLFKWADYNTGRPGRKAPFAEGLVRPSEPAV